MALKKIKRIKYITYLFSLLFISSATSVLSQEINYPKPVGYVNDFANVLDASCEQEMKNLLEQLEKNTTAEVAVVTVESVSPYDSKTYAVNLFEKWGIGKKGKDNGLLILLALQERRVEIEVGYGLEGIITDGLAGEILDKYVVPKFKEGKWGEGLLQGATVISKIIEGASPKDFVETKSHSTTGLSAEEIMSLSFIIVLLGIGYAVSYFSRPPCKKCKRRKFVKRRIYKVILAATYTSSGLAEATYYCKACDYEWMVRESIAQKIHSSSSSGGGGGGFGGGSSGGGGAGRSF